MPAALALSAPSTDLFEQYLTAMRGLNRKTGRSTAQAARSFCAKLDRSGEWTTLSLPQQTDAVGKARSFVSWLIVTGQLTISADLMTHVDLRLGVVARGYLPSIHAWFVDAGAQLRASNADIALQWNALMKAAAVTGLSPDRLTDNDFDRAREAILAAYVNRGMPSSGRNMSAIFTRLRLTLFHCGQLNAPKRRSTKDPITVSGWSQSPAEFTDTARRYLAQVELSLRPNTVKHIDQALREFGSWLGQNRPEVNSCADLTRSHIEDYKSWLSARHGRHTGKPLNRVSVKNTLINLHCFFDRITEWGYPNPPQRPLIFTGDLPIIDKPLPRFLDDAAAAKLMRTSRADTDPLARLIVELLARTGIRKSELLALTVDAVVQIGSAYWLRIPVGKLHNDRYIPLHPQLKDMLDDWISNHRPTGLRSERLLLENNKPVSALRVSTALTRLSHEAGIGHVTPHQLRHTLATQAINRGMSIDAIAALLGHKTLAMTMIYARIADKTVAEEYFNVTEKVEALYGQARRLPHDDEGSEMRKLRAEMHRRMLGNGHCARPVDTDCHFES
ncbi:MAG: tyrosine-type recombinase/integrase, partial [Geodermatophilaceae bacterium]|nr:tyrosine-type recombinase/integrase [Geodermatophilaceae bacterium]